MPDFSIRSNEKELIDRDDIPSADIRQNLMELDRINTLLGGHFITIKGFKKLLGDNKAISVCEIGCGGGDNLRAIYSWCRKKNIDVRLTGIDINPSCISFAAEQLPASVTQLITSDYRTADPGNAGIIFNSLFCHHFSDEELISMLQWMRAHSNTGFFINDLHRHPLAYHFIKWATRFFSRSRLVKNDAPLSVRKGFKKAEWESLMTKAGITGYSIQWKWAFRYLVTVPAGDATQTHLT